MPPRLTLLIWATLLTGCATRGPLPGLVAEIGKADVLVREGCYRCLQEALATYERLAESPRAPEHARRRAFETAVLLTARAKELGLPSEPFMTRARALATQLALPVPPHLAPQIYLDAADYFTGELSGFDPEVRQLRTRRPRSSTADAKAAPPARHALTPAVATDLVAEYLALAIDCEIPLRRAEINAAAARARHGDATLIRFKLASCGADRSLLTAIREADARWVDTLFFEGWREMATRPIADVAKAAGFFASARSEFPESHAIVMALANAQNSLSEYDAALGHFAHVLSTVPTHRDALLGRVMSLSYLNRYTEAVASATQMIDLGTWHIGDAYYWRAWNRYHIYALESAWADIEQATRLLLNTSVYTLAGFIAYARKELDTAIDRFDRAFAMDNTNCEAVWTASLVHVDQQEWTEAAPKFSRAMGCFTAAAAQARAEIEETQAASYAEHLKARRIAAAQKRIDTAEHRKAQAAFNAANSYLRLGQRSLALNHLDVAVEHPLMREKAVALRPSIEKLPQ